MSTLFTIQCRTIRGVTSFAILRGPAVETDDAAVDVFLLGVALRTTDHAVRAVQRKIGLAVIERASAPSRNCVATGAVLLAAGRHELASVNVFVAFKALLRSMRKIGGGFCARPRGRCCRLYGPMTTDTCGILMRAFQGKFSDGVIETAQLPPVPRVVTGFAGLLGRMRVHVAPGASLVGKMILAGGRRRRSRNMSRIRVVFAWRDRSKVDGRNDSCVWQRSQWFS
jgi:hypothetical protein